MTIKMSGVTAWHTTKKSRLLAILREGLQPYSEPTYFTKPAPYIMLSQEPFLLHGNNRVVLGIRDPAIKPEFFDDPEGLRWPRTIKPEHLFILGRVTL